MPAPQKTWKEIAAERQLAKKDQRLEAAGLMNYQTKGMSQQDIAKRYAAAGVQVDDTWFKKNYGGSQFQPTNAPTNAPAYDEAMRGRGYQMPAPAPAQFMPPSPDKPGMFGQPPTTAGMFAPPVSTSEIPKAFARYAEGYDFWKNNPKVNLNEPGFAGAATVQDAVSGAANWTDVSVDQRKNVLSDPKFYETNQITKYPAWMQQQIMADPAFDWKKLPKWQETYYKLSSSPAGMGAAQGGLMGLAGGGVGSLIGAGLGAGLGWAAGKSGYDATKEAWQQTNTTAKAFGWMNFLAEQFEKTVGIGVQSVGALADDDPNTTLKDVFTKEGWNAGAVTFETLGPALQAVTKDIGDGKLTGEDAFKLVMPVFVGAKMLNMLLHPEQYKGEELYLGADAPEGLEQSFRERMDEARARIKGGENYREVMMDYQTGIIGQVSDMAGQAIGDPLNVMPRVTTRGLGLAAKVTGNKVAAEAFNTSNAPMEAAQRYKNLVQTGEAIKIDPEFKVNELGALGRMVSGVNKQGQIKAGMFTDAGLLDAPAKQPKKNLKGFVQEMTSLTPQSRAQIGAGMFYENIGALLTRFDDPHEAGKYLKALSNSDMETWKELGSRFADSPEFYTVLPALKDFNASGLDGVIAAWDSTQMNRDTLTRVADVLGENPSKLLDDLSSRGTADQDFQRIQQKLEASQSPEAKALLGEIQAGRFNAESLKSMVSVFSGEGAVPWHPNQAKALMLDQLGSHFDEWVSKRMMLDQSPEAKSAFFRTAAVLKGAQSILLLGASPGYAIQNGLSNMVHRAATGIYGYLTPNQINGFMDRMGISPARFDEGVGIGGMVEQAAGSSKVKTDAITKAVKGKGPLTDMKQKISDVSGKMPFSKLSSWFEKSEGRQAFSIAMKQFWSQSWRRGTGFKQMSPELVGAIKSMGIDPNRIYAAIEAGLNQGEIEKALYGRFEGVQSRSLIDEAAKKTGLTASQAADMLDKVGVLDTLDSYLKGQTTRDGVSAAFKRAERVAQDYLDMQTGEDLAHIAEHVKQKVAIEQPAAAFEVIQKANTTFTDTWMEHYYRFGEVMNDLTLLDDPAMKSKAIDNAYEISDQEFRRVYARNAANYQGIFDAWGRSGNPDALGALAAMGEIDTAMKQAYDFMRQSRKDFFDKYRNDFDNPARMAEWDQNQRSIDAAFKQAFKQKHDAEVKAGKSLGNIFEGLYGKAAGEAARLWWEDVVKFNDEIVKREQKARGEFAQLPKEQREAAKQKYYSETKILAINEAQKINEQGLARLERVIKRGDGGGTQAGTPTPPVQPDSGQPLAVGLDTASTPTRPPEPTPPPTPPQVSTLGEGRKVSPADEINGLIQQAEQRTAADAKAQAERVASVWAVAEEYGRLSLPYDRTILQDRFALINALRKPEYGGLDITGLNDPRLTPELVRDVMEARQAAKDAEAGQVVERAIVKAEDAGKKERIPKINDNTTILRAISEHGGLNVEQALTLTGEKRPKTAPGVFTKKGTNIDEMARMLADDGYPIDLNDPTDTGGIQQATVLIERARRGDKVYPMGHDHEAAIARAQDEAAVKAFGEAFDYEAVQEVPFDSALWQRDFADTVQSADLSRMYELIGELPEEIGNTPRAEGIPETWNDYVSRMADETAARVEADNRDVSIAESMTRADEAMVAGEVRAEYASTRNMLKEKFTEVFDLSEDQATAYMELSDALSGWYERVTGESGEAFYNRYYNDVVSSDASTAGGLPPSAQREMLQQVDTNRRMSQQEIDAYARALVREGSAELRRAVKNENVKADRVAILDAAYRLNPEMAVSVAKQSTDVLFQNGQFAPTSAKGAVTFDADGIKATIHAFEAKDFSTLVHENAHVFRRMLNDVAGRTDNAKVKADLATIEEWAGVKDGVWDRTAEEKFARGFERYVTEGDAPTPKLKAAFESFKGWMLQVYKQITGSAIDVKLTDEVRAVFDRMLGDEQRADVLYQEFGKPQQKGLFETGEDMPLFSGTAQRAQVEEFRPQVAQKQGTLFDTTQYVEKKPTPAAQRAQPKQTPGQSSLFDYKPLDPVKVEENLAKVKSGLTDFGQKLGGARKDRVPQFAERVLTDENIAKMSLSEIWAKSEIDAIEDVNEAALATAIRSIIPTKPRDGWKLKRWVEQVKIVKELASMATTRGMDAVMERMRASSGLREFADKVTLMQQIPSEQWGRVESVRNYPDAYRYEGSGIDAKKVPAPYASAKIDGKPFTADSFDALITKVQEHFNVSTKATTTMKFEIRGNGKEFFINKQGDPLYRKLKTFTSVEEARAFLRGSQAELTKAWDDVKATDNVKETDVRRAENKPRTGEDHRQGKDATPEMFLDSFGFRGVEFGNWVSQGANIKERQGMLNASFDALMDLSSIIGVPPKAMSLDGSLGLGLGSRGSGKFSAHYEPDAIVINLTKTRGAGSLAHEWLHALDNYFQRKRGDSAMITQQPETRYKHGPSGQTLPATRFEDLKKRNGIRNPDEWKLVEGVRPEVEKGFTELVKALNDSPMNRRAQLIDKGRSKYWGTIIERAARSFENYIIYKMREQGYDNDYLANVTTVEEFSALGLDTGRYPYLLDAELKPVAEAFDNLFGTLETKQTDKGLALFQEADSPFDGTQPVGALDAASQFMPQSEPMDQGWSAYVKPLLSAMEEGAINQLGDKPLSEAFGDGASTTGGLPPSAQRELRNYMNGVKNDMASTKLATMRWGEQKRDFAMLNYNKRYGFDRWLDVVYPYQFFYSRSMATWAARALDTPAWYSNYARLKMQQQRYERDIPERLRNKIKLNAPWLPDWAGDSLYIDPLGSLFTPANFLKPFERMQQDKNQQQMEAERILQAWAADGSVSQDAIQQAAQSQSGATWERALAQAQMNRESEIANPMDFFSTMLGPAWYLSTPLNLAGIKVPGVSKGEQNKVSPTPLANTARALDTVTQGTWAEPVGDIIGMLGKPEEWARKKLGLPTMGEYEVYYTKRQIANMVAEGKITSEQASIAMLEKQGALWDEATQRVKMELAMRVPTMGAIYAGLHGENLGESLKGFSQAMLPTLFGSGLLPAGELEYRGLKQEWNEVWKRYDAGDKQAVTNFFEEHPEYESYLAKGKDDKELMQSFLVGQIWDGYMALGVTNQKQARAEMGEQFAQAFLNKETRSYESIDTATLTQWAQMLNKLVPSSVSSGVGASSAVGTPPLSAKTLDLYDPSVTRITDEFFTQRTKQFGNYYELQQEYFALPKSGRTSYLRANPELKAYWDWKKGWENAYPDLVPIMKGQVFKRVDTAGWAPGLVEYVTDYAYSGGKLPKGAYKALEQVWIMEGRPMDDLDTWLNSTVVPAMLYGGEQ